MDFKQCALFKISQGLLTPKWLSAEMVNINIRICYVAVIATGTLAKAAFVIVGLGNLCLPVSILCHPFVFSCVMCGINGGGVYLHAVHELQKY